MFMRRRSVAVVTALLTVGIAAFAVVSIYVGGQLARAMPSSVPLPPPGLNVEEVHIRSAPDSELVGWLLTPPDPVAGVVLLHGVRGNRWQMIGRAEDLYHRGVATILVDFQGHGESTGDVITFGYLEAHDAVAATEYLRERMPNLPIGGIGMSLGGASFILAGDRLSIDALVVESVYSTIEEAVDNRIAVRLGPLSKLLTPVLLVQLNPRLGFSPSQLRPISSISSLSSPVLVAGGTDDRLATEAETRRLFEAANHPKELWMVPDAGHWDLHAFSPAEYAQRVFGFLDRYLIGSNSTTVPHD
jgi:fermentation-respiration switch protein FrsA (DUF1100 family)